MRCLIFSGFSISAVLFQSLGVANRGGQGSNPVILRQSLIILRSSNHIIDIEIYLENAIGNWFEMFECFLYAWMSMYIYVCVCVCLCPFDVAIMIMDAYPFCIHTYTHTYHLMPFYAAVWIQLVDVSCVTEFMAINGKTISFYCCQ